MTTYAAMLRGINLGPRNRIKMPELKALFEALGHTDVMTYVQSGNVVFKSGAAASTVTRGIEQRIAEDLGLDVTVLVRSAAQLKKVVDGNPFLKEGADPSALHVTFLASAPSAARVRALDPGAGQPDEWRVTGSDVYLHCPNGYGRTKLSNTFFEKRLGVAATTRNWKTVTNLLDLSRG